MKKRDEKNGLRTGRVKDNQLFIRIVVLGLIIIKIVIENIIIIKIVVK
jgi:hypothetical protein